MLALLTDRNLRDGLERGELKNKSPAAQVGRAKWRLTASVSSPWRPGDTPSSEVRPQFPSVLGHLLV